MSSIIFTWNENTQNIITITADATAKIKAAYKKRGSSVAFKEISEEPTYRGENIWEIATSFSLGEYIIWVEAEITGSTYDDYSLLKVITPADTTINDSLLTLEDKVSLLEDVITSLQETIKAKTNIKAVG